MTTYLCNAFSLNMLTVGEGMDLQVRPATWAQARFLAEEAVSAVGHQDTADQLSEHLGYPVKMNRVSVKLQPMDMLLVAQFNGPRLPEGTKVLPEGATFSFFTVYVPLTVPKK